MLKVDKKNALLSGIVESVGVTYVGEKQYSIDTLVQTFEYFVMSQSTYNHLKTNFQQPSISTITKMTSKPKQSYSNSSFKSLAMIISVIITLVLGVIMMQTFSSMIFANCILHVYVVLGPPLKSLYI